MGLTQDQIAKLKEVDPQLAAEAEKLDSGLYIPKERFDEVNTKAKEAAEKLAAREAAEKKAADEKLVKDGEFQKLLETERAERAKEKAQLEAEKKTADEYRALRTEELEAAKKQLGDKWLPEFDDLSLASIRKLVGDKSPVLRTDGGGPGGQGKARDYSAMDDKQFEAEINRVKSGKK